MKIIFKKEDPNCANEYAPIPASQLIPDWYKNTEPYVNMNEVPLFQTIKKCMPIFDAITSGYIITTHVDIIVKAEEIDGKKVPIFYWPNSKPIEFHEIKQLRQYPIEGLPDNVPKFMNAWSIQTPRGYSCMIVNPLHRPAQKFRILEGIVDTDKHNLAVNFPFTFIDDNFEGMIPAGTPVAQVIPFKRDSWKHEVDYEFIELNEKPSFRLMRSTFFNGYKDHFWTKKEFK